MPAPDLVTLKCCCCCWEPQQCLCRASSTRGLCQGLGAPVSLPGELPCGTTPGRNDSSPSLGRGCLWAPWQCQHRGAHRAPPAHTPSVPGKGEGLLSPSCSSTCTKPSPFRKTQHSQARRGSHREFLHPTREVQVRNKLPLPKDKGQPSSEGGGE